MSRRSEYFAPLFVTALLSAAAPVAYHMLWADSPGAEPRRSDAYLVESPMGSWIAADKPNPHLNGTVSFRDSESGLEMVIDNGGVVIRPHAR